MTHKTLVQGNPPGNPADLIASLNSQIKDCRQVIQCDLVKLTIVINGRAGREQVNKVFHFPPGAIPVEFSAFMESYSARLCAELLSLQSNVVLLRLGNNIVELDHFIKDYTAGVTPSIDADTAARIRNLAPQEIITILINATPHQVQRIS